MSEAAEWGKMAQESAEVPARDLANGESSAPMMLIPGQDETTLQVVSTDEDAKLWRAMAPQLWKNWCVAVDSGDAKGSEVQPYPTRFKFCFDDSGKGHVIGREELRELLESRDLTPVSETETTTTQTDSTKWIMVEPSELVVVSVIMTDANVEYNRNSMRAAYPQLADQKVVDFRFQLGDELTDVSFEELRVLLKTHKQMKLMSASGTMEPPLSHVQV
jgi:hypothetical protein